MPVRGRARNKARRALAMPEVWRGEGACRAAVADTTSRAESRRLRPGPMPEPPYPPAIVPAAGSLPALAPATVEHIVADGIARYIAGCRQRIAPFCAANYRLGASLKLHRRALGLDLARAPANVALVIPQLVVRLSAAGLSRLGAERLAQRLAGAKLFLSTEVGRELMWRLNTELLQLPFADGARRSDHDALAEAILADPRLAALMGGLAQLAGRPIDVTRRQRLDAMLDTYTGSRHAAAELVSNLIMAGTGAAALQQLTPGALSLGPALAAAIAQQAAIASFPLGAAAGGAWYALFAATPSAGLVFGVTSGLVLAVALFAPFAGVISDPLQHRLGVHHRRLARLIDALEATLQGDSQAAFNVRDHYVARIFDLIDVARALGRLAS